MSKKKKKSKLPESSVSKFLESDMEPMEPIDSEENPDGDAHPEISESATAEHVDPVNTGTTPDVGNKENPLQQSVEIDESALDELRRTLVEADAQKDEKKPKGWWRRIGRGSKNKEENSTAKQVDTPESVAPVEPKSTQQFETKADGEQPENVVDEIDDLIAALETNDLKPVPQVSPPPLEQIKPEAERVDIAELKKQAFQPRAAGDEAKEDLTEIRSIALQGGEDVFVEVESKQPDVITERVNAFENALRPYKRYIYSAIALVGLIVAVIAGLITFNLYQRLKPAAETETAALNLPYPVTLSLPGGLNFNLAKGSLNNGRWNPQGPEWLEGTEICRWVSLPWSRQLEAVIRTLNPDDPIEIGMSNNDQLTYKVYTIDQLSTEEMQNLDMNTPCLLLVLAESDQDTRWVLIALP